jgi:hypothetical protein
VPKPDRLDAGGIDVAVSADNHILFAAGDTQIARLVDPAEVAGHEPPLLIEGRLGRLLVVKVAEHQAGAAAADLADFARGSLGVRIVRAPDADLIPGTGAPAGLADEFVRSSGSVYWCEQASVMR